jgi:hypothetical protein
MSEPTAAEERERIVSWLRTRGPKYNFSDQRELVADLSVRIEAGEHWPLPGEPFAELMPGESGWYWHEGRVIEVVRHIDGVLWAFWRIEGKSPLRDFPTGPQCFPPDKENDHV